MEQNCSRKFSIDTEHGPSKQISIDIAEDLEAALHPELCIYRVPATLRKVNKSAFTPQVISIGPIHYGNSKLKAMERQKQKYANEFSKRLAGKKTLDDLLATIQECEENIRYCYEENIWKQYSQTDFMQMILLDAIFVIELLWRNHFNFQYTNDVIIGKPWLRTLIQQDLILFENQLPYFVLEKLYNTSFHSAADYPSFCRLTSSYFGNCNITWQYARYYDMDDTHERYEKLFNSKDIKHFLDFVRYFQFEESLLLYPGQPKKLRYSATKLYQAGVKFEVLESKSLLNIKFDKGVLKMPRIEVYDTFECVIRNLMALEQCNYLFETYVCNYFFLLDHLVNTDEDVDLLVEAGIIVNWLGSNGMVADLINRLCQGIGEFVSCYSDLCVELNEHYENRWNHRKATLKLVYFNNLWRGTATLAAIALLVLTLLQTITSIKTLF